MEGGASLEPQVAEQVTLSPYWLGMPAFAPGAGHEQMRIFAKIAVGSALVWTLNACSETSIMNKMGLGKAPPDETQIVSNNNLALPPDLTLPAPSAAAASENQVPRQAQSAVSAVPPDGYAAPAVQPAETTEVAAAEPTPYDSGAQQLETYGTTTPAAGAGTGPNPAVQATAKRDLSGVDPKEDAYKRFGISKTRSDGTPKTQAELDRELLEAVRAEKRKTNPRYGTVFNIGELFKGD
jgi:hypothetical protein